MIVLDTSGVLAALDRDSDAHERAARILRADPDRILSPFVLAELDYLVGTRVGRRAAADLLEDVAAGAYLLAPFSAADVREARQVIARYDDLGIGLADASLVVLAARHRTDRILTLDERHFRALRTASGAPFAVLPADA